MRVIFYTIARFQSTVLLTVVYYLLVPFFASFVGQHEKSGWRSWRLKTNSPHDAQKEY